MADYYDPREDPRNRGRYSDDYRGRFPQSKKPWYKKPWVWIVAGIILLLFVTALSGNLKLPAKTATTNQTGNNTVVQETQEQQLINYIISQQQSGISNENITTKLKQAGYSNSEITKAFELADPVVQYILSELAKGTSKPAIIDALTQKGYSASEIDQKISIAESTKGKSFWETVQNNWLIILIAAAVIAFIIYKSRSEVEKTTAKIYTLEECREYAEEKLKEKHYTHNPCKEYRNRPELKQYRFVYEEPLSPEFNTSYPSGYKSGERQYFLLAVGYDRELIDFRVIKGDADIRDFLYGRPMSWEPRSASTYLQMRQGSETPIPDNMPLRTGVGPYGTPQYPYTGRTGKYYDNRWAKRFSPGPIEGYEETGPWP